MRRLTRPPSFIARPVGVAAALDRLSDRDTHTPRCRDCGQRHFTLGEALACDHRLGRHLIAVYGCPDCQQETP